MLAGPVEVCAHVGLLCVRDDVFDARDTQLLRIVLARVPVRKLNNLIRVCGSLPVTVS